ncbi:interleukin-17 receptor E [Nothobranchius furzeri]|uniref:SEFIR domain-containing protein n=1 Tax=Nothobranchius furzeri TaxID=105023 RepID=A0A1A8AZ95_NOTFU
MIFITVLFLLGEVGAFALQADCKPTCKIVNNKGPEGQCPISLTWVPQHTDEAYSEYITFKVWIKTGEFSEFTKITVLTGYEMIYKPFRKGDPHNQKNIWGIPCGWSRSDPYALIENGCLMAQAGRNISVSYITKSSSCTVYHKVADPKPDFSFSVNESSKTVTITVDPETEVFAGICYQKRAFSCSVSNQLTVVKSAVLNIPHMLPCVCIEVYYKHVDALRNKKCLFQNDSSIDVGAVWKTSEVVDGPSQIQWSYLCPAKDLNISASLCWKLHQHLCIPVLNSTLQKQQDNPITFDTSAVDKHPQMCVQFSIQGNHNISCRFQDEKPPWETSTEAGRRSIVVNLTSTIPAKFSAQLCVLTERRCTPMGPILSVTMAKNGGHKKIKLPISNVADKPCVQVWQSDPLKKGRRILCMDYMHKRRVLYLAALLIVAVLAALLGFFIYRTTKIGAAGVLIIQKPLLLVCSSSQSTHISAVCTLASVLQGELGATVHTSLWAKTSQRQAGNGAGVADLGPIPWLYGKWEAVRKTSGKILIVWSPEAKKTYKKRKLELANMDKHDKKKVGLTNANERMRDVMLEDLNLIGKGYKEKLTNVECFEDEDRSIEKELSAVIEPVFVAALASLEGALQDGKGKEVALVYFQGLCHSRDIPKAFRGVPHYCLPQDFSDLIQELAEMRGEMRGGEFRRSCWHRLLSKVMSMWLAHQLTQRLQTLFPHS